MAHHNKIIREKFSHWARGELERGSSKKEEPLDGIVNLLKHLPRLYALWNTCILQAAVEL